MTKHFNKRIKAFLALSIVFSLFSFFAPTAKASTEVYFQKAVMKITKGETFSVSLRISSSEKIINVVDGTITYDKDKLIIEKVKKNEILFPLWVKEPIFNNETGELSFVAGVPNGLKDKDGQILEITFLAKGDGPTLVGFKDIFSVYLNDGLGTKINPWLKPMSLSIDKKSELSLIKDFWQKPINKVGSLILIVFLILMIIMVNRYKSNHSKNAK